MPSGREGSAETIRDCDTQSPPPGLSRNRQTVGFHAECRRHSPERPNGSVRARICSVKGLIRSLLGCLLIAGLFGPPAARGAEPNLYRIELNGSLVLFAKTPPVPHGARLVFARHPDGAVMSLKRSEVRRVVVVPVVKADARNLKPGELLVLGPTGEGASSGTASSGAGASTPPPGEGPGGKALLNPSRDYRPDWDARQVPGMNLAYPASPGDYREGSTFAYPPGNAMQSAPGQPPTGVPTGEPPKSPQ